MAAGNSCSNEIISLCTNPCTDSVVHQFFLLVPHLPSYLIWKDGGSCSFIHSDRRWMAGFSQKKVSYALGFKVGQIISAGPLPQLKALCEDVARNRRRLINRAPNNSFVGPTARLFSLRQHRLLSRGLSCDICRAYKLPTFYKIHVPDFTMSAHPVLVIF